MLQEEQNRGKPNWEHLNDELHVLITVEDTENRAKVKLQRAVEEIKKLLVPAVSPLLLLLCSCLLVSCFLASTLAVCIFPRLCQHLVFVCVFLLLFSLLVVS